MIDLEKSVVVTDANGQSLQTRYCDLQMETDVFPRNEAAITVRWQYGRSAGRFDVSKHGIYPFNAEKEMVGAAMVRHVINSKWSEEGVRYEDEAAPNYLKLKDEASIANRYMDVVITYGGGEIVIKEGVSNGGRVPMVDVSNSVLKSEVSVCILILALIDGMASVEHQVEQRVPAVV